VTAKIYRLLGADGRCYQSQTPGVLGGNRRLKIYGRLDCPSALRAVRRGQTYAHYRVFFADEDNARAAGFRPCAVCMRDAYKKWRAGSVCQSIIRKSGHGLSKNHAASISTVE
jgi:methylphosphotriester-DNA--protein-cysteine methyltransferase